MGPTERDRMLAKHEALFAAVESMCPGVGRETFRALCLKGIAAEPEQLTLPPRVQQGVLAAMGNSRLFRAFCEEGFGRFLHHQTEPSGKPVEETCLLYRTVFGHAPPVELWGKEEKKKKKENSGGKREQENDKEADVRKKAKRGSKKAKAPVIIDVLDDEDDDGADVVEVAPLEPRRRRNVIHPERKRRLFSTPPLEGASSTQIWDVTTKKAKKLTLRLKYQKDDATFYVALPARISVGVLHSFIDTKDACPKGMRRLLYVQNRAGRKMQPHIFHTDRQLRNLCEEDPSLLIEYAYFPASTDLFNVFVKTPAKDQTRCFQIRCETTVQELKNLIAQKTDVPPDQQRVIFCGKTLEKGFLADYNVGREATLSLAWSTMQPQVANQ